MSDPIRLVIVGGSDAGISAALRAREVDPRVDVTVMVADAFPNYSIRGLPFYLSGETPDWRSLAHRTAAEIEAAGIRLLLDHTAQSIDPIARAVTVVDAAGREHCLEYDRLVVVTGAAPARPPIAGLDLPGVFLLHTMADSFRIDRFLNERVPPDAIVVGAGYIGVEMADALTHRGLRVTLVGRPAAPLPTVDLELGRVLEDELRRHGVATANRVTVEAVHPERGRLTVTGSGGFRASANVVLVAAGVRPATRLASEAGVPTGVDGALRVDRAMATAVPDVWAAGDCVETWHRVLERSVYVPLGTTAHKQGRVAGENAVGGGRRFAGSLGTQVVKIFDLAAARTGLLEGEARAAGFDAATVACTVPDHKAYYPGAHELRLRVVGDRRDGRLLGAQIVGHRSGEVAKRIDVFAAALFHRMTVEGMSDLDLSYTPPFSSSWEPVQVAAQAWVAAHD